MENASLVPVGGCLELIVNSHCDVHAETVRLVTSKRNSSYCLLARFLLARSEQRTPQGLSPFKLGEYNRFVLFYITVVLRPCSRLQSGRQLCPSQISVDTLCTCSGKSCDVAHMYYHGILRGSQMYIGYLDRDGETLGRSKCTRRIGWGDTGKYVF